MKVYKLMACKLHEDGVNHPTCYLSHSCEGVFTTSAAAYAAIEKINKAWKDPDLKLYVLEDILREG